MPPAEEDEIERRVAKAWSTPPTPEDGVADRLRDRVMSAYVGAGADERATPAVTPVLSLWRWMMARPLPRIGLPMTATAAALVLGWLMIAPQRGYALDEMVAPLLEAETVRCRFAVKVDGKEAPVGASVMMAKGTLMRQERAGGDHVTVSDHARGVTLEVFHNDRDARVLTKLNRPPEQAAEPGFLESLRRQIRGIDLDGDETVRESLGEKVVDGRKLVGYRVGARGSWVILWGDPKTGLPHSLESAMGAFPGTTVLATDFEFGVPLDPALFSLDPPEGYQVTRSTLDLSAPTEGDFLVSLRTYAQLHAGAYPESIDLRRSQEALKKFRQNCADDPKWQAMTGEQRIQESTKVSEMLSRGFSYVLRMKPENDAAYAGAGLTVTDGDRPIFWSKPNADGDYRVVRADLTVIDSPTPPSVESAQPYPIEP